MQALPTAGTRGQGLRTREAKDEQRGAGGDMTSLPLVRAPACRPEGGNRRPSPMTSPAAPVFERASDGAVGTPYAHRPTSLGRRLVGRGVAWRRRRGPAQRSLIFRSNAPRMRRGRGG